jgi:preprotein translocase subunit YajC
MGGLTSLLPLALMVPFVLMLFWSGRSQSKKHQKLISELKKGDGVLTQGGMRGKLVEIGDRYAKVEIAPGTKIEVLRSAIVGRDDVETAAQLEKK